MMSFDINKYNLISIKKQLSLYLWFTNKLYNLMSQSRRTVININIHCKCDNF